MNTSQLFIDSISIILAIITLALTIVTGYIGYLSITFKNQLNTAIDSKFQKIEKEIGESINVKLKLVDTAVSLIGETISKGKGVSKQNDSLYLLTHIIRLTSGNDREIKLALRAIEGFGSKVIPLLPHIERIKNLYKWSQESHQIYDEIFTKLCSTHE